MTTTVIDSDSLSTFVFQNPFDTHVILSDGNVAPSSGVAIATASGFANLVIEGSAVGVDGFEDGHATGGDSVTVGQNGALVGTGGDGLVGGDNCIIAHPELSRTARTDP